MKSTLRHINLVAAVIMGLMFISGVCSSEIITGTLAPEFSLKNSEGMTYTLSAMKDQPMVVLYFFDIESRPSQEGLLSLDQLAKKYRETRLNVWAITRSPDKRVSSFMKETGLDFPVLTDTAKVSKLYNAHKILPTVCVIGPGLKVIDYFQGGGKTTEIMLVRIAERELQQKNTTYAKALGDHITKINPRNVKAAMVKGYAALKENRLEEAENVFTSLAQKGEKGEIHGKEGLAAVYGKKGQNEKALKLIEELEQKAPERSFPHVVKGDILFAQNKKKEAEAEYQKAVHKKTAEPYHEAKGYNQLGRIYANAREYEKARELYDRAVNIDPYYIEGTTNKGLAYEKEGRWDKALDSYRQALAINGNDDFAAVLLKKAEEMLTIQKDAERRQHMNTLIKDLAERYHSNKKRKSRSRDIWTSAPMILSFVDFQEKGGLAERDGFSTVLMTQLADQLNASGRVKVVERVVIERLLDELNLGSSDLADTDTALRLGKVLAARLLGTGSLYYLPGETMLNLRLIDTETTAIPLVATSHIDAGTAMGKEVFRLNREILKTVIEKYPLKGFIIQQTGDEFVVNLGSNQGVVLGTKFSVVEEQEPIRYKGRVLKTAPRPFAEVEVVRIEPDICFVRIVTKERSLKADDRVLEKIDEALL